MARLGFKVSDIPWEVRLKANLGEREFGEGPLREAGI